MSQNYTPIDDLIQKLNESSHPSDNFTKESEPMPKRSEPIKHVVEKGEVREVVEHKVHEDVKPYVHARKESISVPSDLARMGVRPVATPKFADYKQVLLPITDDNVLKGLRAPFTSSLRWLSELCLLFLKHAHLHLKVVHGKVRRVFVRNG